jgi:biopolymer transport protein ExbD
MNVLHNSLTSVQAKAARLFNKHRGSHFSLRMTSMIDVIFLLLIFFVLTAKFSTPEQFLPVLMSASAQTTPVGLVEPVLIDITSLPVGCSVRFGSGDKFKSVELSRDDTEHGLLSFADGFAGIIKSQNRTSSDPVQIQCDDKVKWGMLIKIYNILYGMGISDITFGLNE